MLLQICTSIHAYTQRSLVLTWSYSCTKFSRIYLPTQSCLVLSHSKSNIEYVLFSLTSCPVHPSCVSFSGDLCRCPRLRRARARSFLPYFDFLHSCIEACRGKKYLNFRCAQKCAPELSLKSCRIKSWTRSETIQNSFRFHSQNKFKTHSSSRIYILRATPLAVGPF